MLFERARLEALEAQTLAPYAVKSGQSRGREHRARVALPHPLPERP